MTAILQLLFELHYIYYIDIVVSVVETIQSIWHTCIFVTHDFIIVLLVKCNLTSKHDNDWGNDAIK